MVALLYQSNAMAAMKFAGGRSIVRKEDGPLRCGRGAPGNGRRRKRRSNPALFDACAGLQMQTSVVAHHLNLARDD
jgi:hypothetical protein